LTQDPEFSTLGAGSEAYQRPRRGGRTSEPEGASQEAQEARNGRRLSLGWMVSVLVGPTATSFWNGLLKVEGFAPGHGESIDVADVISNMSDSAKHARARGTRKKSEIQ